MEKNCVIKTVKRKTKVEMHLGAGNMISKFFFEEFLKDETHLFTHARKNIYVNVNFTL